MAMATRELTYEDYLCGPEEMRRYDILDGAQIYMPNPTVLHQIVQGAIFMAWIAWHRVAGPGHVLMAPCDVLIRRAPLRTRQPDVLFISAERFGERRLDDPSPLDPAPELVVEILSPSDRRSVIAAKLADYRSVGVLECWVVSPGERTVEVLRLTADTIEAAELYNEGSQARSHLYPELIVPVSTIFASL
ncbi:MAG TPA: Uma2 family endonuclease [Chthonomonadaceae bacterium]|nr:Uma2 family endonuclease [Chthonomonadaceae bacterium]